MDNAVLHNPGPLSAGMKKPTGWSSVNTSSPYRGGTGDDAIVTNKRRKFNNYEQVLII